MSKWRREEVARLLLEVRAEIMGSGDISMLADFSSCIGPDVTRKYAMMCLFNGGLTSFNRPGHLLWVVVER